MLDWGTIAIVYALVSLLMGTLLTWIKWPRIQRFLARCQVEPADRLRSIVIGAQVGSVAMVAVAWPYALWRQVRRGVRNACWMRRTRCPARLRLLAQRMVDDVRMSEVFIGMLIKMGGKRIH